MSLARALAAFSGVAFLFYGLSCLFTSSMVADFQRFGMEGMRVPTGVLEVLGGAGLLVGLWWPPAMWISSGGLGLMMLIAFGVRLRMRDSVSASLPSLMLAVINLYILARTPRI